MKNTVILSHTAKTLQISIKVFVPHPEPFCMEFFPHSSTTED